MVRSYDIVLVCKTKPELRRQLSRWKTALEEKDVKISRTKAEYLQFNDYEDLDHMKMDEEVNKKVQVFKYLGTHVSEKMGSSMLRSAIESNAGGTHWGSYQACSATEK